MSAIFKILSKYHKMGLIFKDDLVDVNGGGSCGLS